MPSDARYEDRTNAFLKLGRMWRGVNVTHIFDFVLASCCCQPGMYFKTSISRNALASGSDGRLAKRISRNRTLTRSG